MIILIIISINKINKLVIIVFIYNNKIKSRTNIPKKYSINENFKEQFSDNTNFRKYNNISGSIILRLGLNIAMDESIASSLVAEQMKISFK